MYLLRCMFFILIVHYCYRQKPSNGQLLLLDFTIILLQTLLMTIAYEASPSAALSVDTPDPLIPNSPSPPPSPHYGRHSPIVLTSIFTHPHHQHQRSNAQLHIHQPQRLHLPFLLPHLATSCFLSAENLCYPFLCLFLSLTLLSDT